MRVLQTQRLRLMPAVVAHASGLFPFASDPRLSAFLAWAPHASVEETARVLAALEEANAREAAYHWTIFDGEQATGLISLIDVRRTHRLWTLDRAEVAYWVAPQAQGRGIATAATSAVIDEAFAALGMHRLVISHAADNPASGRVPQKLGFRFIGTECAFFQKNGIWHDMRHYELLAEDWAARAADQG